MRSGDVAKRRKERDAKTGFAEKARGRKDRREEGKKQKRKQKNAPIPFHNPRIIVPLERQVLIPNEPSPKIGTSERVGGGWA
jgi:hypothetical protein